MLIRKGIKQAEIADRLNVSGATVSMVLSGRRISATVQAEIARLIGREVKKVFPTKAV